MEKFIVAQTSKPYIWKKNSAQSYLYCKGPVVSTQTWFLKIAAIQRILQITIIKFLKV
jgi:hypothetical protein